MGQTRAKSAAPLLFWALLGACDGSADPRPLAPPIEITSAALEERGVVIEVRNDGHGAIEALRGSAVCLDRYRQRIERSGYDSWNIEWDRQELAAHVTTRIGPWPPPDGWTCAETRVSITDVRFADGAVWSGWVSSER